MYKSIVSLGRVRIYVYTTISALSPVRKNLSSKFDVFLADRSQFDSDHHVDFYAHTCCQSATFGSLFAFYCPLFLGGSQKRCTKV